MDNIKKDLREAGYDAGDWIDIAQNGTNGGSESSNETLGSLKALST